MNLVSIVLVVALWPSPPDNGGEFPGPPLEQRTRHGTSGPITFDVFEDVYFRSAALADRRHPYSGSDYFTRSFKYAVMQGQGVYGYRDRPLHLIHNYNCDQPAGTAEIPWTCRATVFVMKGSQPWRAIAPGFRPQELEDAGVTLIAEKDSAEVEGAFEAVVPHPSRPLFAGVNHGCCDSPSRVSVHDFDGRLICPPADLYLGDVETGPWDRLPIEGNELRCPDGQRVKVPPSLLEEARSLIRRHAGQLPARYRLPESGDARWDWNNYARPHGHPPVIAYGDYNDDGVSDLAFVMTLRRPSRVGEGFALFCLLSRDDGSFRLVTVAEDPHDPLAVHGLATVRPGRHPTVCALPGTPRAECERQPKEISLEADAIHWYAFEGAGVFYVWDAAAARFRRVQVAD